LGDALVADVMKWVDENMVLKEITDEQVPSEVLNRLDKIRSLNKPRIPVAILAEVRLYQQMNQLSAENAIPYYSQYLSNSDAEILANGTAKQRRVILTKAVPKLAQ
jgi:hypothetical protein